MVRSRRPAAAAARLPGRRCGARSSRRSSRHSAASCRAGTESIAALRCAKRSCRCKRWRSRSGSGSPRCCRAGSGTTAPSSSTSSARPASSSGPAPGSTGSPSSSARTRLVLGRPPAGAPSLEGEAHDAIRSAPLGGALFWDRRCSPRPGSTTRSALPALWDLVWAGEVSNDAWAPLRAERRYQPSRPDRRTRRFPGYGRSGRPPRRGAGRPPRRSSPAASPTGVRSPSCCSSGRGSSRATRSAARGFRAAMAPSTPSCARSRRSAPAAAATSSRGSAARSSRSAARSSGCASCGRATGRRRSRSCSRPPTRRNRTAPRSPGRSGPTARAARVAGAHVVLLGGAPALYVERGGRSLVPLRDRIRMAAPGAGRARRVRERGGARRLAVERFDGEPVVDTDAMPLLVEAGFLAGPRRAVLRA